MAFNEITKFNGVTSVARDSMTNNLLLGVQDFLSWGFLQAGGFQNITISPAVSGSFDRTKRSRLRASDDPSYEIGQVWEGFRNDWVWESGFKHSEIKPIQVSGVWIDSNFYEPSGNAYSHFVDYPNGRIVFDSTVPTTKTVEANFSHRTIGVALSSEKFVQEVMFDSYDMEDIDTYLMSSSGVRNQLGERRLQLPFVAVELAGGGKTEPYQLGGGKIAYNDVLMHVFADDEFEKNNIRDILLNQSEKVIILPDRALIKQDKKYPLQIDRNGSPVKNAKNYRDFCYASGEGGYAWRTARIEQMRCSDMEPVNNWLHRTTIRATFSVIVNASTNVGNI